MSTICLPLIYGLMITFFVIMLILLVLSWIVERQFKRELQEHGVKTKATIIKREDKYTFKTEKRDGYNSSRHSYFLTYQYTVDGTAYTNLEGVRHNIYDWLTEGSTIDVTYLPTDPKKVRLSLP